MIAKAFRCILRNYTIAVQVLIDNKLRSPIIIVMEDEK